MNNEVSRAKLLYANHFPFDLTHPLPPFTQTDLSEITTKYHKSKEAKNIPNTSGMLAELSVWYWIKSLPEVDLLTPETIQLASGYSASSSQATGIELKKNGRSSIELDVAALVPFQGRRKVPLIVEVKNASSSVSLGKALGDFTNPERLLKLSEVLQQYRHYFYFLAIPAERINNDSSHQQTLKQAGGGVIALPYSYQEYLELARQV